jgi:hypothetical protein
MARIEIEGGHTFFKFEHHERCPKCPCIVGSKLVCPLCLRNGVKGEAVIDAARYQGYEIEFKALKPQDGSNPSEKEKMPEKGNSGAANLIVRECKPVTFSMPYEIAPVEGKTGQWVIIEKETAEQMCLPMNTAHAHHAMHWLGIGWMRGLCAGVEAGYQNRQDEDSPVSSDNAKFLEDMVKGEKVDISWIKAGQRIRHTTSGVEWMIHSVLYERGTPASATLWECDPPESRTREVLNQNLLQILRFYQPC